MPRRIKVLRPTSLLAVALFSSLASGQIAPAQQMAEIEHFHPKGKPPSESTRALQAALRESLPFEDDRDFEEQRKGFVAVPDFDQIIAPDGHVAWDMGQYEFLLEGRDFDSIHPSLQRQAILNMNYGLYQVTDRIYQVRGFDLANMTFIEGDTGWIVIDTLTAAETSRAALDFVNRELGERPVVAVVFSHSHGDHFGGVLGILDEADVRSGKVQLIAPKGFLHHVFSENVYAGNAMQRRLHYQYAALLGASPFGPVDSAIGKRVANGRIGVLVPNRIIEEPIEELTLDGVRMVFHNTPGTEAPAEMNTWFPDWKALWMAENVTGTIHNIYTLRGALVRDSLAWSKKINEALYLFGQEAEVMFASHNWPRWGNERIREVLRDQRDIYAHLNNQVLHLANSGVTINQIHNVYEVPESLQRKWHARGYHGSFEHNSRGVINRYLGYWDANPATLVPVSPEDSAPLFVEMMGGAEPILGKAGELYERGEYSLAVEILDKLVYAEPGNPAAKDLLADCFEQLGYRFESPSLRNSFLAAAYELRSGIPRGLPPRGNSPDMLRAMPAELFFDYLGILVDSRKAVGLGFKINFVLPDTGEQFVVEMSNATLTSIQGFQAEDADLTVEMDRSSLLALSLQQVTVSELMSAGRIQARGNLLVWQQLQGTLGQFDPFFEILPGTKASAEEPSDLEEGAG